MWEEESEACRCGRPLLANLRRTEASSREGALGRGGRQRGRGATEGCCPRTRWAAWVSGAMEEGCAGAQGVAADGGVGVRARAGPLGTGHASDRWAGDARVKGAYAVSVSRAS